MQAFLPLLMGTGDTLYDDEAGKWVVGEELDVGVGRE